LSVVKVRCKEGRFVGHDKYEYGREYTMDAARAGKYANCFTPIGRDDDEAVAREWGAIKAQLAKAEEDRRILYSYDPSILAAAAKLIQEQSQKRLLSSTKVEIT
jgi:hypothetical protein